MSVDPVLFIMNYLYCYCFSDINKGNEVFLSSRLEEHERKEVFHLIIIALYYYHIVRPAGT